MLTREGIQCREVWSARPGSPTQSLAPPVGFTANMPRIHAHQQQAEADSVCGADFGERSPERVNSRNGYRHRDFDTRAGSIDVAIPKLRQGSYFPDWLLEPRKRAEKALTTVVATCYLLGVSTRRMDKLVQSLGISGLSKSQVSVMAKATCSAPSPACSTADSRSTRSSARSRHCSTNCSVSWADLPASTTSPLVPRRRHGTRGGEGDVGLG